jgi:hypothetical protein
MNDDAITNHQTIVVIAGGYMAKAFQSQVLWKLMGDARAAIAHIQVHLIQRARLHVYQYLSVASHGSGALSQVNNFVSTVTVDIDRFHMYSICSLI